MIKTWKKCRKRLISHGCSKRFCGWERRSVLKLWDSHGLQGGSCVSEKINVTTYWITHGFSLGFRWADGDLLLPQFALMDSRSATGILAMLPAEIEKVGSEPWKRLGAEGWFLTRKGHSRCELNYWIAYSLLIVLLSLDLLQCSNEPQGVSSSKAKLANPSRKEILLGRCWSGGAQQKVQPGRLLSRCWLIYFSNFCWCELCRQSLSSSDSESPKKGSL